MVIPVFNHASTLLGVAMGALRYAPVIVVDDGSTDGARTMLEAETAIESVFEPVNRGKGIALKTGFRCARERGYTHAITLDADGQHDTDQVPDFVREIDRYPESIILGTRDLRRAEIPAARRFANAFSSFWFRIQTKQKMSDTQCGFRAYPLGPIAALHPKDARYGFEYELLVHAAWMGIEIRPIPIRVDYAAPTSRRSHFRPVIDFIRMSVLNAKLTFQALALPAALRRSIVNGVAKGGTPMNSERPEHPEESRDSLE